MNNQDQTTSNRIFDLILNLNSLSKDTRRGNRLQIIDQVQESDKDSE